MVEGKVELSYDSLDGAVELPEARFVLERIRAIDFPVEIDGFLFEQQAQRFNFIAAQFNRHGNTHKPTCKLHTYPDRLSEVRRVRLQADLMKSS